MIVALATTALFTGCKKTSDFNKYLVEDFEYVRDQYPDRDVVFYEAQVTLNGSPAELGKKSTPLSVKEVFQVVNDHEVIYVNRNYETGEVKVEAIKGAWCEDVRVIPTEIADYTDALKALLNAEGITLTDSPLMTLRNPLGPTVHESAFYIFGSNHTSFVAVDAKTLEVTEFNGVESYFEPFLTVAKE